MPYRRCIIGTTIAVPLIAMMAACSGHSSGAEVDPEGVISIPATPESGTFKIATEPWIGYAPWYVAEKMGEAQKNNVSFKVVNFTTDDQLNAALAGGKVDGANVSTHTALNLIASGVDIKIVMLEDVSYQADAILARPGITSVKDLKGKRVAYEEGTTSDILLRNALHENAMSINDITRVPMPAADAGTAFIGGRVDAAVTYEPYISTARVKDSQARVLYTAAKKPGLISDVFVVRSGVLAKRPGQVAALVKTWNGAIAEYIAHPKQARSIMAKGVGAQPSEVATAFDGIRYYGRAENNAELSGDYAHAVLPEIATVAKEAGILQGEVNVDSVVDDRFLQKGK